MSSVFCVCVLVATVVKERHEKVGQGGGANGVGAGKDEDAAVEALVECGGERAEALLAVGVAEDDADLFVAARHQARFLWCCCVSACVRGGRRRDGVVQTVSKGL